MLIYVCNDMQISMGFELWKIKPFFFFEKGLEKIKLICLDMRVSHYVSPIAIWHM